MTRLLSASSDHGRGRRQRAGPGRRCPPSVLRSRQVGRAGVRLPVYQNLPEQNLPRLPGQEETQEERRGLAGGQRRAVAAPPAAGRRGDWCRSSSSVGLPSGQQPAVIRLITGERRVLWSEPGRPGFFG